MVYTRVLLLLVVFSCAYGHKMVKGYRKHYDHNVGIIGGHNISIEQVPYMVSLRYYEYFLCGGSIIHERFILSAAHCMFAWQINITNKDIKVKVGSDRRLEGGKLYDVDKIIVHEQYLKHPYDYDICILKLNDSLTFGLTVNKVLLTTDIVKLEEGTLLNATGWGSTNPYDFGMSDPLQQVTIPVASREECNRIWSYFFTERLLCVGESGKDTCFGDSGGPLMWNNVQVGITSTGGVCGKIPSLYTKISAVKPWIEDTIKNQLKEEKKDQKTKREKRQKPARESSPITKKIFKRTLL